MIETSTKSDLLRSLSAKDPNAFRVLMDWLGPLVMTWIAASKLSGADREDVAQDVFATIFQKIDQYDQQKPGSFRGWVRIIARNKVIDHIRRDKHISISPDMLEAMGGSALVGESEPPQTDTERQSLLWVVCECIRNRFKPTVWAAFWETTIVARKATEVAEDLGVSPANVRQSKRRVLVVLRAELRVIASEE